MGKNRRGQFRRTRERYNSKHSKKKHKNYRSSANSPHFEDHVQDLREAYSELRQTYNFIRKLNLDLGYTREREYPVVERDARDSTDFEALTNALNEERDLLQAAVNQLKKTKESAVDSYESLERVIDHVRSTFPAAFQSINLSDRLGM